MIYLDANATSRIRPQAEAALRDLLNQASEVRNPSSIHQPGQKARTLLRNAREAVRRFLLVDRLSDVRLVFTSGGTEACNQMIFGFLGSQLILGQQKGHIVTSSIEHPAVLEPLLMLEQNGWSISRVNPGADGRVEVKSMISAVREDTALVSLMTANNETGAVQPVCALASSLRDSGFRGLVVSDMTQALSKTKISAADLFEAGVDAIALSGHKLGTPSGIGALVYQGGCEDRCLSLSPHVVGGSQEQGYRAGTENLFGAVALGAVAEEILHTLDQDLSNRTVLRERMWKRLSSANLGAVRLSPEDGESEEACLSNTLLVRFPGCRGDDMVVALDLNGVAASAGSACSSGTQKASHVTCAMGLDSESAREAIRLSLDWDVSEEQIDRASEIIINTVRLTREDTVR